MSTRTASGAKTLPGKYYTSEEIFQLESKNIFSKQWLYAGRICQLKNAGSYFLFNIDHESIIILRDQNEGVKAFYNVCRHRGTRLCSEAEGKFSKTIQCPYHAWTYDLQGNLLAAPNMNEVTGFDNADYPLHEVELAVWEGGIFINLAEEPEPFEKAFKPLIGKFEQWNMPELAIAHHLVYEMDANWKLIFQNYSECYHCPNLHPQLNRLTPFRNSANDLEEGPFLGGPMKFAQDFESMTMSGRRCAAPLGGISGEDLRLVYYYTIFPNMLLSLHPDYVLIHQIHRQSPTHTRIVCDWLFHPDAIAKPDFDASDAIKFWNTTNKQDWQVSELSQQGIASQVYSPGPYSELESMIADWDRHYLETLSSHSNNH